MEAATTAARRTRVLRQEVWIVRHWYRADLTKSSFNGWSSPFAGDVTLSYCGRTADVSGERGDKHQI
jgi:hypothetical protein